MPHFGGFVVHRRVEGAQEGRGNGGKGGGGVPPDAYATMVGAQGRLPVEGGGGKVARVIGSEIVPRKVQSAGPFRRRATAGDGAGWGLEFEAFSSSPQFEGGNTRGARDTGGGPRGGMKVEIAHKDGGNIRAEVQAHEGREGRGVVNIVVEGNDPQNSRAVMYVGDK